MEQSIRHNHRSLNNLGIRYVNFRDFYGLKQSPSHREDLMTIYVMSKGIRRSKYDSCVYMRQGKVVYYLYLLLYVDDMLIGHSMQRCL